MSTHTTQDARVVSSQHARSGGSSLARSERAIECKSAKGVSKSEKLPRFGARSGVSVNLSGTSIKTRVGRTDKKSVAKPLVQIDDTLIKHLLRSGPECLQNLSALAEEFRHLGKEDANERAFVIETATLCLRQACAEAEAGASD